MNSKDSINKSARNHYLTEFKRSNDPSSVFGGHVDIVGRHIVDIMKKEDLTHDQAYASLQYTYNLIQYEANFLRLN
ncbi:hypothetical protein [Schleiferilactobacillus harbinensis]|uniref:hypothetical protein n=1 Tax=Schleiferilactobacillus harbinensis TaxID=304207 RepID=UPI00345EF802